MLKKNSQLENTKPIFNDEKFDPAPSIYSTHVYETIQAYENASTNFIIRIPSTKPKKFKPNILNTLTQPANK